MIHHKPESAKHIKLTYIFISIVMSLPVLLLPVVMFIFHDPMITDTLAPIWAICIALLLMTSVSMDTLLYGAQSLKQAFYAILWVCLSAILIVSAIQNQNDFWLLGILFLVHSQRSGYHLLIRDESSNFWWLWSAWSRDITAVVIIFIWLKTGAPY